MTSYCCLTTLRPLSKTLTYHSKSSNLSIDFSCIMSYHVIYVTYACRTCKRHLLLAMSLTTIAVRIPISMQGFNVI